MPYDRIDPARIRVKPLAERDSPISIERTAIVPHTSPPAAGDAADAVSQLADAVRSARQRNASVILAFGPSVIKHGCGLLINELIKAGHVTHLATDGGAAICDWEFAFQGSTASNGAVNATDGAFGAWAETGVAINLAAVVAAANNWGLGETLGRYISEEAINLRAGRPDPSGSRMDMYDFMLSHGISPHAFTTQHPYKKYSVAACAYDHKVPLCVMPAIGADLYACHPMFTPTTAAALGRAAAVDFHTLAHGATAMTGGVYIALSACGSRAQVFEKAFAVANNLLQQDEQPTVTEHQIVVADAADCGDWDWSSDEDPPTDHPAHAVRSCRTFARLAAPGGSMHYVPADARILLHNLVKHLAG